MSDNKPQKTQKAPERAFYSKDENSAKVVIVAKKGTSTLGVKINGKANN